MVSADHQVARGQPPARVLRCIDPSAAALIQQDCIAVLGLCAVLPFVAPKARRKDIAVRLPERQCPWVRRTRGRVTMRAEARKSEHRHSDDGELAEFSVAHDTLPSNELSDGGAL